jgi:glucose-6-phosphate 1-dehydrogenase
MSEPLTFVIFGATGDLTARKLIPSLYRLHVKGRLSEEARIVGAARSTLSDETFRARLSEGVRNFAAEDWQPRRWEEFAQRLFYVAGDPSKPGGLDPLQAWLKRAEGTRGRRLYYLAVAPDLYPRIITQLGEAGMSQEDGGWRRIVIEKPFGRDLASARALNRVIHAHFQESQVYRIDHYLGKETVQNLVVFRFANSLFEPVWNHQYIEHVQITVAESVTVGQRGEYYDKTGVLRDMFQNHLLQILTLVAMEGPARFAADPLRNEKLKVLDAIRLLTPEEAAKQIVCSQYAGYRSERGVAPDSKTPTFAAVRLNVDNWRWQGVPFYLRSGKGLKTRCSEVVIQFHCPPHLMFPLPPGTTLQCNRLTLVIQPNEGIYLNFQTKVPDAGMELKPADLRFFYREAYPGVAIPEAYERLLLDAIQGDASLFMRSDEIERAWEIIDPFLAVTEATPAPQPEEYAIGTEGPKTAETFISGEGRRWLQIPSC